MPLSPATSRRYLNTVQKDQAPDFLPKENAVAVLRNLHVMQNGSSVIWLTGKTRFEDFNRGIMHINEVPACLCLSAFQNRIPLAGRSQQLVLTALDCRHRVADENSPS